MSADFQINRSFQPGQDNQPNTPAPTKPKRKFMPAFWYNWSKRTRVLASLATVLLVGGVAAIFLMGGAGGPTFSGIIGKDQPEAKSTTVASPLTGLQVAPDLAKRPVTGIMIENSPVSRPQSGIYDAGVIFEAIAEGGITRFIALYQEAQPIYVGPVRSLRPYYIYWSVPFDAGIAHVGGSPDALADIRNGGKDLDQFFNPEAYWRQEGRESPHNVYTSFEKMNNLNTSKGYTSSSFKSWPRKTDAPMSAPTHKNIDLDISGPDYTVHYTYEASSNAYLRSLAGGPHIVTSSPTDAAGLQLRPKVVIVLVMNYRIIDDAGHSGYDTMGSGSAYIFQDGGLSEGTWHKADKNAQFELKDKSGQPIKLNAGQTWVTVVQGGEMTAGP